jgi:predicted glycosyl hydrolase (DUF1957 family)
MERERRKTAIKRTNSVENTLKHDGLLYFLVDTYYIDKSNSTELSEAINSMFRWYQNAVKCYVYLSDILT